jgi:hypothetical protein
MTVHLTNEDIDAALQLPQLTAGLEKYVWIQAHRDACDVRANLEFRRRFNGFYRVRRSNGPLRGVVREQALGHN